MQFFVLAVRSYVPYQSILSVTYGVNRTKKFDKIRRCSELSCCWFWSSSLPLSLSLTHAHTHTTTHALKETTIFARSNRPLSNLFYLMLDKSCVRSDGMINKGTWLSSMTTSKKAGPHQPPLTLTKQLCHKLTVNYPSYIKKEADANNSQ